MDFISPPPGGSVLTDMMRPKPPSSTGAFQKAVSFEQPVAVLQVTEPVKPPKQVSFSQAPSIAGFAPQ